MPLFVLWSSSDRLAIPVTIVGVLLLSVAALLLVDNTEVVLTALGKDPTLTGRTALWQAVWSSIMERPWVGYGYGAFWTGWQGPSRAVFESVAWEPPHAHNGILDLWLSVGFVGVAIFVAEFGFTVVRAIAAARAHRTAEGTWPLAFLSFMFLYNATESTILRQHTIYWVLYVAVVASRLSGDGRQRSPAGASAPERGATNHSARASLGLRRRAKSVALRREAVGPDAERSPS
jgi:exopolysaccharide production protein ExoQ